MRPLPTPSTLPSKKWMWGWRGVEAFQFVVHRTIARRNPLRRKGFQKDDPPFRRTATPPRTFPPEWGKR